MKNYLPRCGCRAESERTGGIINVIQSEGHTDHRSTREGSRSRREELPQSGTHLKCERRTYSMPIDLYYIPGSAPCRSVMLVAKALGVDLNLKLTNLMAGEHLTPEFIKLNPQHTIPTFDDNGFVLCESRAILGYLVQQYGKDDSLYPKDPKKRAMVDQRLYFDMGTLYQRFADYNYPVMFAKASFEPAKLTKLEEAYEFLDKFLEGETWVAGGDHYTIADISIAASVSTADVVGFDVSKYPNVARWFAKVKTVIPGYEEINQSGCLAFKQLYDNCLANK